jgi:hypothetical protein
MVSGTWALEVETKGLEYISESLPSPSGLKKHVSSTLISLPIIEKALVEEETQVGIYGNPKLEYETRGTS